MTNSFLEITLLIVLWGSIWGIIDNITYYISPENKKVKLIFYILLAILSLFLFWIFNISYFL